MKTKLSFCFVLVLLSCGHKKAKYQTVQKGSFVESLFGEVKSIDEYSIVNNDTGHHFIYQFDKDKRTATIFDHSTQKLRYIEYYDSNKNIFKMDVFESDTLRLINYFIY